MVSYNIKRVDGLELILSIIIRDNIDFIINSDKL